MRKFLFIAIAIMPTAVFSQATETATNDLAKVTTGLSISLIVMVCLVAYLMVNREKLVKRNKELSKQLNQLQKNQ